MALKKYALPTINGNKYEAVTKNGVKRRANKPVNIIDFDISFPFIWASLSQLFKHSIKNGANFSNNSKGNSWGWF